MLDNVNNEFGGGPKQYAYIIHRIVNDFHNFFIDICIHANRSPNKPLDDRTWATTLFLDMLIHQVVPHGEDV